VERFKAFRVDNTDGRISGRITEIGIDDLAQGEVVFKTAYSSVNYKDALAATGAGGKIIRKYPLVAGIDAAGTVVSSMDARFKPGDTVICTSYDMGVGHDGGFSEYCRVPAAWCVALPPGLTLFESMALGTAGYTAGLAMILLELNGLEPGNGPVLVNGATGGVATLAIDMLSKQGYAVTAMTGKSSERDFLVKLGAADVIPRPEIEAKPRPLEKSLWAAAFDSVGGVQLAWLTRTMQQHGLIASFGNAGGIGLDTTVLPFILRGVRLIGVDSAQTPMPLREQVWQRLSQDLKPRHLDAIASTIRLDDLPRHFEAVLNAQHRGRAVVQM
jgi:putative YhdH/YhfP family quinone oxidoreductase